MRKLDDCYYPNQRRQMEKDLRDMIEKHKRQILTRLNDLPCEPFPHDYKHLSQYPNCYRIDEGEYRICYKIDKKKKEIIFITATKRNDDEVYKAMKRLAKGL